MAEHQPRARTAYAASILLVICLGLLSRSKHIPLPAFIAAYAGDTLWALLIFLGFGWLFPAHPTFRIALYAAMFSLGIELSQLYHVPWLDAFRANRFVALVLGQGFLWSDLVCYAVGIALGVLLFSEAGLPQINTKPRRSKQPPPNSVFWR